MFVFYACPPADKCLYFWWNWCKTCFHWNIPHTRERVGVGIWSPAISNPWRSLDVLTETDSRGARSHLRLRGRVRWSSVSHTCLTLRVAWNSVKVTDSQTLPNPIEPESPVYLTTATTVFLEHSVEHRNGQESSSDSERGALSLAWPLPFSNTGFELIYSTPPGLSFLICKRETWTKLTSIALSSLSIL